MTTEHKFQSNESFDPTKSNKIAPVRADVNHYRTLNVAQSATGKEIREAYIRQKAMYCGDNQALYSMISDSEAQSTLVLVEEAFHILNDDLRRDAYDTQLRIKTPTTRKFGGPTISGYTAGFGSQSHLHAPDHGEHWRGVDHTQNVAVRPAQPIRTTALGAGDESVQAAIAQILEDGDSADGDLFRRLREACQVSIDEMQDRTKILADYIRGIEENRFERLPPVVYVRGFLRSFLRYLAVPNADRLVSAYAGRLDAWRATSKT